MVILYEHDRLVEGILSKGIRETREDMRGRETKYLKFTHT